MTFLKDLFESYSELIVRAHGMKYADFEDLRKQIGALESELEKRRCVPSAQSEENEIIISKIGHKIEALKHEWDENDTFNKFIQYSLCNEMHWIHSHKISITHFLEQLARIFILKQSQWIGIIESSQ